MFNVNGRLKYMPCLLFRKSKIYGTFKIYWFMLFSFWFIQHVNVFWFPKMIWLSIASMLVCLYSRPGKTGKSYLKTVWFISFHQRLIIIRANTSEMISCSEKLEVCLFINLLLIKTVTEKWLQEYLSVLS